MEPTLPQHDETIVPLRPTLGAAGKPSLSSGTTPRGGLVRGAAMGLMAAGAVLAVAVAFYWLPARLETERLEPTAPVSQPELSQPEVSPLTPEEQAAFRAEAEELLAGLLTLQDELGQRHAELWAKEDWESYRQSSDAGDNAFLAQDFRAAVASYSAATELGKTLLARATNTIAESLRAAESAFAAGDAARALSQYDVVLTIDPAHAAALAGRARAEKLPQVLALVTRGDAARERKEWQGALTSYREALALDPAWEEAAAGVAAVNRALRDAEFEQHVSAGFAGLASEDFAAAQTEFKAALALRPSAAEALDGLAQAEQGEKLDQIALSEVRALAFERRELWAQAIALYRSVLASDDALVFAQQGLQRAEVRAGLDAKLSHLIDNPTLLFADDILADADKLLVAARTETTQGPRLKGQIEQLGRLIDIASTPLRVQLKSDQITSVTVYRVGALGAFDVKDIELRPGTYTVIGSRDGYRDVRQTFTVRPGRNLAPISVVCSEPI